MTSYDAGLDPESRRFPAGSDIPAAGVYSDDAAAPLRRTFGLIPEGSRTSFSLWSNAVLVLLCAGWFLAVRSDAAQVVLAMAVGSASHSLLVNRLSIRRYAITVIYRLAGLSPSVDGVASWHRGLRILAALGLAVGFFGAIGGTMAMISAGSDTVPAQQVSSTTTSR